jgi:RNA-directed DNA polymerase
MAELSNITERIGINENYFNHLVYNSDKFYKSYYIKKTHGGKRVIDAPNFEVKSIQAWILKNILEKQEISDRANGFVHRRSIKTHALYHINKKYILCIDIKDFFNTIKLDQVKELFTKILNNDNLAEKLSLVCTFKGYLPQGGVTSPFISNLIFFDLDEKIKEICDSINVNYSRYADDLTFSSNYFNHLEYVKKEIYRIIKESRFTINNKKTRFLTGKNRMLVTGIILNSGKLTTGRKRKRNLRAAFFNYYYKGEKDTNDIDKIIGMLSFIRSIEPYYYKKFINYKKKLDSKIKIKNYKSKTLISPKNEFPVL